MSTPWTAEQIAALAPDAASLTAARRLRGTWSEGGQHGTALWGLCRGSGSRPYQTIVDLAEPAYKCTCLSRKFPCKHALSLLLTWAEGDIPAAGEVADYAAQWLGGRTVRAAKRAASDEKPGRSVAGSERRRARVSSGLADLDMWLTDQIRTGLAQSDRTYGAYEAVAARMVDAQAPAVAAVLRRLPRLASRREWPRLLLTEYARLHLLATAHRRLDTLSPALRAAVRTHVGYPTPVDSVRAEAPLRDQWQVLGLRTTVEESLYTRRVWLRGRTTGRWALLVDHHYGSAAFPADTPPPGFQLDADLHFYPAAAALRALWGARHGLPEPFTTLMLSGRTLGTAEGAGTEAPSSSGAVRAGTIAAALDSHARALGADPFLRSWPVLLVDVVPVRGEGGWQLVEADGQAIPLSIADGEPWRLLGLSGGYPVTVVGEWTVDGLAPIAAPAGGEMVDIGATEGDSSSAAGGASEIPGGSAELVSAALIGTGRRSADPAGLAGPVAAAVTGSTGDPAVKLLEAAALQECFTRGGVSPGIAKRGEVADDDVRPLLPPAASARLAAMLADNSPFLDEWFAAAGPRDFRAPDALCSLLLDRAKSLAAHREPLLRLAGVRGRWLAGQHPGWKSLVRAAVEDESVWSHGRAAERRIWLAQLRHSDPEAARAALAGSWSRESGPGKAELLGILGDGLAPADEALLESALDDRRAEVRRVAADLLGRLPDSAFAQRMTARAAAWLTFGRVLARPQLSTTGPGVLDDAARRDGVGDSYGYTAYRADGAPDLAAEWLHRVVAGTPLRHWERVLGRPEQAVRTAMNEAVRGPMFAGLSDAALAQRDSEWARALFGAYAGQRAGENDSEKLRELFALQPLQDQVRHLRTLDSSWLAEIESLLRALPHPWPGPMAEHVLRLLLERAQLCADRPGAPSLVPGSYRTLFRAASAHFPVTAADMVSGIARTCGDPYWEQAFDQLADDLFQRTSMLEELQ
ncbi:DUF5691 domain-containing protein [Nocardia jejuensis]|uniref:DUF5691 domain-containing protein n=1 Tax=Nocardia jejuensis TaxID=328049 RepID=UPI00082AFEAE|nr:DUF5691 domain-containing protein [Nocardia jejuensis]